LQFKFTSTQVRQRQPGLNGWHVLVACVLFFAAVFAINAALIYSAISTYSGVVASEPFRKGLFYNDRILADERQQRLNWLDSLTIDRAGRVALAITSADGRPILGLNVVATVGRPSTSREDVKLSLSAGTAGLYEAKTKPLAAGSWIVSIEARASAELGEPIFRARRRLWIAS
jgi:nitrogen fixation protein FixH